MQKHKNINQCVLLTAVQRNSFFSIMVVCAVAFIAFVANGAGVVAADEAETDGPPEVKRFTNATLAVVNVRKVLANCDQWKDSRQKIKQVQEKAQSTLEKMKRRLQTLQIDFENLPSGTEKKGEKRAELKSAVREYQKTGNRFEQQINKERNKALSRVLDQVNSIVAQYAQKNDIDLVLKAGRVDLEEESSPQATQAVLQQAATADVLYANERYDISEEIIQRMNARQSEPVSDPPTR